MIDARALLRIATRGWVLKERLPAPFGTATIYTSPEAQLKHLRFWRSNFEAELFELAARVASEAAVVWDIGANLGAFSLACAMQGATVYSFEPDPFLVRLMRKTRRKKGPASEKWKVIPVAISARTEVAEFLVAGGGRNSNALASHGGHTSLLWVRDTISVPVFTIDDLVQTLVPPTMMKIDVEGGELDVLSGATGVLADHRPLVYIEVSPHQRPRIEQIFRSLDYRFFVPEGAPPKFAPGERMAFNTLAVPSEKAASWV
jgi:FkbM family methyltransferase